MKLKRLIGGFVFIALKLVQNYVEGGYLTHPLEFSWAMYFVRNHTDVVRI